MKKNIGIVYSTNNNDDFINKFNNHLINTCGLNKKNIEIYSIINHNKYSLTEVYNFGLNFFRENFNISEFIIIFIHHDIEFDTKDWGKILLKHFNNPYNDYQIIGLAGVQELHEHACWWLNKNRSAMNISKMIGIVNHFNGIRKWTSKYSDSFIGVKPVVVIDGLFMAIDGNEICNGFDESYKGFHLYDVSFCLENYLNGCNVGVITDIRITHESIGETNQQWEENRIQLANQYKDDLPIFLEK